MKKLAFQMKIRGIRKSLNKKQLASSSSCSSTFIGMYFRNSAITWIVKYQAMLHYGWDHIDQCVCSVLANNIYIYIYICHYCFNMLILNYVRLSDVSLYTFLLWSYTRRCYNSSTVNVLVFNLIWFVLRNLVLTLNSIWPIYYHTPLPTYTSFYSLSPVGYPLSGSVR